MNILKSTALSIGIVSILSGCGSAKDANKDNFEDVFNLFYKKLHYGFALC